DLIEGFVKYINGELRRELQKAVAGIKDRRDTERVGMLAFYEFLRQHRAIYRLVPEFEMIDQRVGMWYYEQIAQGYTQGLDRGIERGEIRDLPVVFLARALMGLTHFIALKWIVWNPNPMAELPKPLFKDVVEFVCTGLQPP
ncbi:MAG: hypothetical protein NTY64_05340, partial [Deltaproteobacteria bacterium]|nr:hypothetical protein [Deltaproteobacteria bacterium]